MDLNYSQRQFLYANLKDVLNAKFEELGNKTMKEVYGVTTQTLVREAVFTHCFHKKITLKERIEKYKKETINEEGKKVSTPKERIFVTASFKVHLPVTNESFDISREIPKEVLIANG